MVAVMNEKTMMYVINKNHRILYMNEEFKSYYPQIMCGQACYQALGHIDMICSHCPVYRNDESNVFYNESTEEWIKAQTAELDWEGEPDCHAILVKAWDNNDEITQVSDLSNEASLQKKLTDKEEKLQEQQQKNQHRLAIIQALSREYGNVYCVDLETDTFETYRVEAYLPAKVYATMVASQYCYSQSIAAYVEDSVHEADRQMLLEALQADHIRKQLEEEDSFACNYRIYRDGVLIYYQVKCVRMNVNGDNSKVIVAFCNVDREVRKEMEQKQILADAFAQAEYANRAKTTFLNNMSHDIRTPMNAILGMTAIAAMHIDDKERVADALNKITLSGKHLLGLINSVLDMSKIESGRISLVEEEFNLSDTIDSLIALFYSQMVEKKMELKVDLSPIEHEDVIGDDRRLQQILINIMGNAIKFTPEGGKIFLGIREKVSHVAGRACYEFVFEDNGIGMDPDFIDKIFEPFARAPQTVASHVEGSGLGMSIAVNIARLMGGDIQVASRPGQGSRFTVTVYLQINHVTPQDIHMLAELPVLVVDDEELACESACEILRSLEMRVEYVLSGDDAVERVRQAHQDNEDFSVVILDWKMPGKDGVETAREIRAVVGDEIPIIILSAYDWSDIEQEATLAGVNAFIEKPLFRTKLTHVLTEILGVPHNKEKSSDLDTYVQKDYSGRRVLLVEDNELNVEVAKELLEMVGLKV
jgi:signal transduction histidine kinase/FixJ family two-component response regulator